MKEVYNYMEITRQVAIFPFRVAYFILKLFLFIPYAIVGAFDTNWEKEEERDLYFELLERFKKF